MSGSPSRRLARSANSNYVTSTELVELPHAYKLTLIPDVTAQQGNAKQGTTSVHLCNCSLPACCAM
jgi:hypothetical protein